MNRNATRNEQRPVDRPDDVGQGDVACGPGQPEASVGAALAALALLGELAAAVAELANGAASTKAEGGRPPMVSASAAFNA